MIVIADYGMGNLRSVANAFHKIQADACVTSDPEVITRADRIVMPGVGAFDEGMRNLRASGLVPILEEKILQQRTPVLGICLGLQLLTRRSDEGRLPGLGWLEADTVAFNRDGAPFALKVPHMGWNNMTVRVRSPLVAELPVDCPVYFAHGYYLRCDDDTIAVAQARYGVEFPAIVQSKNLLGTQFHPEKSLAAGLRVLANFASCS